MGCNISWWSSRFLGSWGRLDGKHYSCIIVVFAFGNWNRSRCFGSFHLDLILNRKDISSMAVSTILFTEDFPWDTELSGRKLKSASVKRNDQYVLVWCIILHFFRSICSHSSRVNSSCFVDVIQHSSLFKVDEIWFMVRDVIIN